MNELPKTRRANEPTGVCVVVAVDSDDEYLRECVRSVREHMQSEVPITEVTPSTAAVNRAIEQLAPADVIVLSEPCRVSAGWVQCLCAAARSDTNTASASALADAGTPLALGVGDGDGHSATEDFAALAEGLAKRTLMLRPRLNWAVGPCIYLRRDALELVGSLDERLDLRSALETDFAQRCLLSGMTHVAADDVVVERLRPASGASAAELPSQLRERYPYLAQAPLADSSVLGHALRSARPPDPRLSVTLDARALDGAITGTHVHILELILALVRTDALKLRLLVRAEQIDSATRQLLEQLAETELLAAEDLKNLQAPRSTVFHRPQQTFSPSDVGLALALGERLVISQLDLIAYRNPGYFADADTWEDYRAASRHGLSAAERVVVFSQHTRDELVADALVEPSRIRIVPPGLDHRTPGEPLRPPAFDPAGAASPAPGFLLCLGTDFRHKNRVFALRLLAALRELHGWRGSLVLAGTHISPGSSAEIERDFMAAHPELDDAVVSLGPVSDREKAWLIANAGAIVYPSVYEGFGLVPFESALNGVPCLFAPQASLAEAAPDGTATIVPWDAVASAAAAHLLLTDDGARERHVGALADRARELTWDAAAAAMVEIYREAALAPVRDSATLSRDLVKREARLSVQHDAEVAQLVSEREHAKGMYDELNAEVGSGLSLIGPHGTLPDSVQRALLALSARPGLSRPLFAALARTFLAARALAHPVRRMLRRAR
ncbi:MAG TPA: glycosyltransferase [Solirubrobacteraceae bacterium]|nr:glycosyltransferase [Solirubrobacteraceae bacterium]